MALFIGERSTVLINLDNVEYAEGGPSSNDTVTVHLCSGAAITLEHGNARMFVSRWLELAKEIPCQSTHTPTNA